MTSVTVNINSIDKVKRFVSAITSFDNDFDLGYLQFGSFQEPDTEYPEG